MSELRWILLGAGVVVLGLVWVLSRSAEISTRVSALSAGLRRRSESGVRQSGADGAAARVEPKASEWESPRAPPQRIVTVRLVDRTSTGIAAEALILALREAGLRHGRRGIFHRHAQPDDAEEIFSVASLVEPGSFDLTRLKDHSYPGVSLFLLLPGPRDPVAAFDDMLSTARSLAAKLDAELLDEQGSRLSVQRERYLREEVIQFNHRRGMVQERERG